MQQSQYAALKRINYLYTKKHYCGNTNRFKKERMSHTKYLILKYTFCGKSGSRIGAINHSKMRDKNGTNVGISKYTSCRLRTNYVPCIVIKILLIYSRCLKLDYINPKTYHAFLVLLLRMSYWPVLINSPACFNELRKPTLLCRLVSL